MIDLSRVQIDREFGSGANFAQAVEDHKAALINHMMGMPGFPRPAAHHLVESVIERVPASGPVATRKPDKFVTQEYQVIDDRPKTPEQEQALDVLRETVGA